MVKAILDFFRGKKKSKKKNKTVLVLEPEAETRELITLYLKPLDLEILFAETIKELDASLKANRVHVLVMELILGTESTIPFLKSLRKPGKYSKLPVILMSRKVTPTKLEAYAKEYTNVESMLKPLKSKAFQELVQAQLNSRESNVTRR